MVMAGIVVDTLWTQNTMVILVVVYLKHSYHSPIGHGGDGCEMLWSENTIVNLVVVYARISFYSPKKHRGNDCGNVVDKIFQYLFWLW